MIRCQKDYVSFTYPFKSHDSHRGFNLKLPALWPCQGTTVIFSIPRSTKTFLIACQHDAPPQLIPKVCHRVCEAHTRLGKIPPPKKKSRNHVSFMFRLPSTCPLFVVGKVFPQNVDHASTFEAPRHLLCQFPCHRSELTRYGRYNLR